MSLDRTAAAKRALPRTGVSSVDEEALLLLTCLSRMDVSLSRALAEGTSKKTQTIPGAHGDRIDVTGRTAFGRPLELNEADQTAEEDNKHTFVFKSDANVASAALLRLAQHAAYALKDIKRLTQDNETLRQQLETRELEVASLRTRVSDLEGQMAGRDDPEALFDVYKKSWAVQHSIGQAQVKSSHEEKQAAISRFLVKQSGAFDKKAEVSTFRLLYQTSESLLAKEFKNDDQDIDNVVRMFQQATGATSLSNKAAAETAKKSAKKSGNRERELRLAALSGSNVVDDTPNIGLALGLRKTATATSGSPVGRAADIGTPLGSDFGDDDLDGDLGFENEGETATSLLDKTDTSQLLPPTSKAKEEAAKQASAFVNQLRSLDVHKAQKLRMEDYDADAQELTRESLQKVAAANRKRAKTRSNTQAIKSASLVITYYGNSNTRKVAQLDDAGTLMYQLRNVFVEAPTTFSNLVIDRSTLTGKSEVLSEQAKAIGLGSLWNDMMDYDQPVVRVMHVKEPEGGVHSLQEDFEREAHVSDMAVAMVVGDGEDPAASQEKLATIRQRMAKLKFFRNLSLAEQHASSGNPDVPPVHLWETNHSHLFDASEKGHRVTCRQCPGIIHFLATSASGQWVSPIQTSRIRCYASSMMDACRPDALVMPFSDVRSPFFMTCDEPMSSITISFAHTAIIPTGYSVSSVHPITGGLYPRSWKLEGSLDQLKWTVLRSHLDDTTLSRYNPTFYWDLPKASKGQPYFQHLRITQLKPNACGSHNLCMSAIEFYGRIIFVEGLTAQPSHNIPRMRISKVGFPAFSSLPAPKAAEVKSKKK